MNCFRNPGAWPRSITVDGVEMPLTDREVSALLEALTAWREMQGRDGRTHSLTNVAHFFATGQVPDESQAVSRWRRHVLRSERRARRDAQRRRRGEIRNELLTEAENARSAQ